MTNPFVDPIRYGLIIGLGGGTTFAIVGTAFNYFTRGLFAGLVFWVGSFGLY